MRLPESCITLRRIEDNRDKHNPRILHTQSVNDFK